MAAEARSALTCPPRITSEPRAADAPVDDVVGVRRIGLRYDEAASIVLCSNELLVVTPASDRGFRIHTSGDAVRQGFSARFAEPRVEKSAQEIVAEMQDEMSARAMNRRVEDVAPGQAKWFVGTMGLPDEERVINVAREEWFPEGRNPTMDAVEKALVEKYGEPTKRGGYNDERQLVWAYDPLVVHHRDVAAVRSLRGQRGSGPRLQLLARLRDRGHGRARAAQGQSGLDARVLQVGVVDQAGGSAAIESTEQTLRERKEQRRQGDRGGGDERRGASAMETASMRPTRAVAGGLLFLICSAASLGLAGQRRASGRRCRGSREPYGRARRAEREQHGAAVLRPGRPPAADRQDGRKRLACGHRAPGGEGGTARGSPGRDRVGLRLAAVRDVGILRLSLRDADLSDYDPTYGEFVVGALAPSAGLSFPSFGQKVSLKFGNGKTAQIWHVSEQEAREVRDKASYLGSVGIDLVAKITKVQPSPAGGTIVADVVEYELRNVEPWLDDRSGEGCQQGERAMKPWIVLLGLILAGCSGSGLSGTYVAQMSLGEGKTRELATYEFSPSGKVIVTDGLMGASVELLRTRSRAAASS